MNKIIPALLESKFDTLKKRIEMVYEHVPMIQIDMCDGEFVESKTWPYSDDMDLTALHSLQKYFSKVELDLMVKDPIAKNYMALQPAKIVLHWHSFSLDAPANYFDAFRAACGELGLAIPATTNEFQLQKIADFLDIHPQFTYIQIMGIKVRGRQGQQFHEEVVGLIKQASELLPEYPIQIDGGMNARSVAIVRQLGVNTMIAGSSVWDSENALAAIQKMESVVI